MKKKKKNNALKLFDFIMFYWYLRIEHLYNKENERWISLVLNIQVLIKTIQKLLSVKDIRKCDMSAYETTHNL